MPPNFHEASKSDILEKLGRTSFVSSERATRHGVYRFFGKRLFDVVFVILMAPFVLPILAPLILLVAMNGGMPLYSQIRVGKKGKQYRMWKLRSMVPNADEKLQYYIDNDAAVRAEWDKTQKLKNDPRVTNVGRFLRKSSLDELPQLWNVLKGDMSLVGPRPMLVDQRSLYPGHDYYELRPGITGLWQVSARNESTFADRARFDAKYNESISLLEDVRLIFATVWVVFGATGH